MESILPTNEYVEVEGRGYINPQVALDESTSFIDNLRALQGQQNQEITQQTKDLGTEIPSNLGGLTGAESYFTSRYQTPQTNAVAANLRATAQAAALNDVLANEQAIWKNRYQQAYRNYQKSAYNRSYGGGGNTSSATGNDEAGKGKVTVNDTSKTIQGAVPGVSGGYTVGIFDPEFEGGRQLGVMGVPYGQDGKVNYEYRFSGPQGSLELYSRGVGSGGGGSGR